MSHRVGAATLDGGMTAAELSPSHPVAAEVASARAGLGAVAGTPLWSMNAAETGAALVEVTRLLAQVAQCQLRLPAHAKTVCVGQDVGATSPANWAAVQTRSTRAAMHRSARLAARLQDAHPEVDTALARAAITVDQAQVIVDAVDALPTDLVSAGRITQAEAYLLEQAADHDAKALRILGRRLLEVLDPEAADEEEARRLDDEEREARAGASFTMSDDGHGTCHGRFRIPSTARGDVAQGPRGVRQPQPAPRPVAAADPAPTRAGFHGVRREPR